MNIVISGTVGVGKSTTSKKLKELLTKKGKEVFLMEEINEDNPILDLYYKNREEWSFTIQIDFVLDRFKKAYKFGGSKDINIFDRHFLDDYIFSSLPTIKDNIFMNKWYAYQTLNSRLSSVLKEKAKVDYFFLLKADLDEILKRISSRGREAEKEVDIEYWRNLYNHYYENEYIQDYIKNNVENFIIVDANTNDQDEIVNKIIEAIGK